MLASAGTHLRNRDWQSDETLFAAAVVTSPRSSKIQANPAITLFGKAEALRLQGARDAAQAIYREACQHFERSVAIDSTLAPVRVQYGVCLARTGREARAEEEFRATAALGSAEAWLFFYRAFVDEARAVSNDDPDGARALHRTARSIANEHIRPLVSPQDFQRFVAELADLERALSIGPSPPDPG